VAADNAMAPPGCSDRLQARRRLTRRRAQADEAARPVLVPVTVEVIAVSALSMASDPWDQPDAFDTAARTAWVDPRPPTVIRAAPSG
jgi:hypothetical protein